MKGYVILSKSRFLFSASIIMVLLVSLLFTLAVSARAGNDVSMVPEYVEEGDTLWIMSQKYAGDMDIREYIYIVMNVNNLDSANIIPGKLLFFPSY